MKDNKPKKRSNIRESFKTLGRRLGLVKESTLPKIAFVFDSKEKSKKL